MKQGFENTPTFPLNIYKNLPRYLSQITEKFADERERDIVLLSSIVVLGGCFSDIKGMYRDNWVSPNIYAFIVAPPGSGKGVMRFTKYLGSRIQSEYLKTPYKDLLGISRGRVLFIPGDTSSAAFFKLLSNNKGKGIIFEAEADALATAIKKEWGNFDHLLRCAFHHEDFSRTRLINDEYSCIERGRISVLLSGTPDQVPKIIPSAENGIFSRFVYYCFSKKPHWRNATPDASGLIKEEFFKQISDIPWEISKKLEPHERIFRMTNKQLANMDEPFSMMLEQAVLYDEYVVPSIVYRLGLIFFRIAMTLTVIRKKDELDVSEIVCSDEDYTATMGIVKTLFEHSLFMFGQLPTSTHNFTNPQLIKFFKELPTGKFERKQANLLGKQMSISERTVNNYLERLIIKGFLDKTEFGTYMKDEKDIKSATWKGWNHSSS